MSFPQRTSVQVTTAADGTATAFTPGIINGQIIDVIYTKDGTTPYSNGVVFAITGETTGLAIWNETGVNASETHSPVQGATLVNGVDSAIAQNPVYVANERVKIVLASGGNATTGNFQIIWV